MRLKKGWDDELKIEGRVGQVKVGRVENRSDTFFQQLEIIELSADLFYPFMRNPG